MSTDSIDVYNELRRILKAVSRIVKKMEKLDARLKEYTGIIAELAKKVEAKEEKTS